MPAPVIQAMQPEVQAMKAAVKVEVYFASDHFCLFKEPTEWMGT